MGYINKCFKQKQCFFKFFFFQFFSNTSRIKNIFRQFNSLNHAIKCPTTLPSRHKDVVTTLLRRRYPTSLWRRHIVAMETSDDVTKTTSFQRPIKRRHNETLQRRRFCNVIWRFHCNYMATSERRRIATSQRRCNVLS